MMCIKIFLSQKTDRYIFIVSSIHITSGKYDTIILYRRRSAGRGDGWGAAEDCVTRRQSAGGQIKQFPNSYSIFISSPGAVTTQKPTNREKMLRIHAISHEYNGDRGNISCRITLSL